MINLVKNEIIKIYAKSGFILLIIVIIAGVALAPIIQGTLDTNDGAFYLHNLAGSLPMINLFTVITSSTILNSEISNRTIKFLGSSLK